MTLIHRLWERLRRSEGVFIALGCVLAAMLVVSMCTGYWPSRYNAYDSYTRQAEAWLNGTLYLPDGEWLEWLELAIYQDRYYVSFPPFPSYVLLPFVAVFGRGGFAEGWIALAFALAGVVYACRLYRAVCGDERHMLLFVLYLTLSNGWLFLTVNGWVWFFAQNMCFTLSLMALYYAWQGRGGWSMALWACAVGCRPMVVLYLPLLLWLLIAALRCRDPEIPVWRMVLSHLYWGIPPLVIGGSYMALNYMRFGDVLEFGHNYLPEFTRLETGQFSLTYFAQNFASIFRLPVWNGNQTPVGLYGVECMAFWMVNPIFVTAGAAWTYALLRRRCGYGATLVMLPLMVAAHLVFLCCHHTMGGQQFGNRYLVDMLPYVFLGLLVWMPRGERFARWTLPLMCFGAALNLMGTVMSYNFWI